MDPIARLLDEQVGVIARRQVLANGGGQPGIDRALRRREWARVLPGVFVNHTGPLTWQQRAWAGVLFYWPAALGGTSALRAAAGPGWRRHDDQGRIEIAVALERTLRDIEGYRVERCAGLPERVHWHLGPPRVRVEHAAIDVASAQRDEFAAVAVLADVCQSRRTTAARILDRLADRSRVSNRAFLEAVLRDVAEGTCSVLEHGYLTRVERAHRLPEADRQPSSPSDRGPIYRDVHYGRFGFYVELDGRLFHDNASQRDRDLDRDLDAAVDGRDTVRLGWGQVFGRPCRTTNRLASLLQTRGWDGVPSRCGPGCTLS